ncbi:hypothetical protein NPIL_446961 [Nephila pilipes]|uniref:DNA (cytosine-5-)-methyltransferase n=1 Tax=Nephila pilipes TaxID=299642 RepID=A0A8X6QX34_NEPPI|nr:hypothetical protein NPIL_446961 [Nephila pilipes]
MQCKSSLANVATLTYLTSDQQLCLLIDASNTAVGAALNCLTEDGPQHSTFLSCKLSATETKYSMYDRELFAIYLAIKHFWQKLEGLNFIIFIHHHLLTFAFNKIPDPCSPPQLGYLYFILQFSTDIGHVSGSDNSVADVLSIINVLNLSTTDLQHFADSQTQDEELKTLISSNDLSIKLKPLKRGDALKIFCDAIRKIVRRYVPEELCFEVFRSLHNLSHPVQRHTVSPIQPFAPTIERFQHFHVDLVGPFPPFILLGDISADVVAKSLNPCWEYSVSDYSVPPFFEWTSTIGIDRLKPAFLLNDADLTKKPFPVQKRNCLVGHPPILDHNGPIPTTTHSDLPPLVLKHLKNIRKSRENAGSCSMDTYTEDSSTEKVLISNVPLNKVRDGSLKIEDMCISCKLEATIVDCHPLFEGGICFECKESLKENIYSYGYDGKTMCCVICAHPGCLILCDNKDCFRSYCSKCITELIGSENLHKIREMNPWQCFFCSNDDYDDSLLKTRKDWEERLLNCFQPIKTLLQEFSLSDYKIKKPIRVLSLFDGIGTGRVVLDLLGIKVEKYYASEIDDNAINVSKFHFNDSITYIGNIRNLTDEKIQSISPIDLVIGGSPCNDLSLVNPERKGIYDFSGTGYLFFDFFHVLKSVQRLNNQKHVFFLFENVASMNQKTKRIISSFLMQEPALIDSKFVSPQARARYFWGNIPGMHTLYKYWTSEHDENLDVGFQKETLLSHCLLENLGRKAVVEKIRTVTTQKNSLIQENCTVLPVEMNGEPDSLWLTELEKVFGFPVHFTDIGNLSISKRQELIGRSWSVPVVKDILRSFKRFFKCEDDPLI